MVDLNELADRVERLTGPDRDVDALIKQALCIGKDWSRATPEASRVWSLHYTDSIDAAAALRPDGAQYGCVSRDDTGRAWAWCSGPHSDYFGAGTQLANAANPAIALTAAALRARAVA